MKKWRECVYPIILGYFPNVNIGGWGYDPWGVSEKKSCVIWLRFGIGGVIKCGEHESEVVEVWLRGLLWRVDSSSVYIREK